MRGHLRKYANIRISLGVRCFETRHTLGNRQEGYRYNPIAVRAAHLVMYVSERHVHWMVLLMSSGDRNSRLVHPEDHRREHGALVVAVLSSNGTLVDAQSV